MDDCLMKIEIRMNFHAEKDVRRLQQHTSQISVTLGILNENIFEIQFFHFHLQFISNGCASLLFVDHFRFYLSSLYWSSHVITSSWFVFYLQFKRDFKDWSLGIDKLKLIAYEIV